MPDSRPDLHVALAGTASAPASPAAALRDLVDRFRKPPVGPDTRDRMDAEIAGFRQVFPEIPIGVSVFLDFARRVLRPPAGDGRGVSVPRAFGAIDDAATWATTLEAAGPVREIRLTEGHRAIALPPGIRGAGDPGLPFPGDPALPFLVMFEPADGVPEIVGRAASEALAWVAILSPVFALILAGKAGVVKVPGRLYPALMFEGRPVEIE